MLTLGDARRIDRRLFVKAGAAAGIGVAWFGGAHVLLRDDRWTPNQSFWVSRGRAPVGPPLRGDATVDLAVIGGGVTGLSTAVHVLERHPGLRVALLEAQYAGFGATGRSGGILGDGTEIGMPEGTDDNVSHALALIDRHGIDCDLQRAPITQLDPYKYAVGLKRVAIERGAAVYEGTRVGSIEHGRQITLAGDGFTVRAPRVVVAANGYTPRLDVAPARIFPVHTMAAVTVPLPDDALATVPDEIFIHTSREMYIWGRKAPGGRVLVGSGAEYFYDNGLDYRDDPFFFRLLHRGMAKQFPALRPYPFEHRWSGPMGCTIDQEPIIGRAGDGNLLYCGAYSGHGIAMGTKMGSLVAGLLDGGSPPAWLLRRTSGLPGEPFRYVGVKGAINLMNLSLYKMREQDD